ncbi:hypothetical protein CS0771_02170 [Catellatospora sp. IY07-71]|uniref:hypothetical protein n=1 Tax=Catellatospora sp. IY07-71 TaxID=2728827 RepID=UPI001BB31ECA|nr:hypothetical protein [Catellatospora sp. IY07-71]BCJ70673.1 hypothetical protein CS0771_02170 [Catellatospora sp. IY07-71]
MAIDTLRAAIAQRRVVTFFYKGYSRSVIPMAVGQSRDNTWMLRGQQVAGGSSSGGTSIDAPKLFKIAEVMDIAVSNDTFAVPSQYRPGDSAFVVIEAEL